jgi:hypothetical protein
MERSAAVSEANLKILHGREVEKLKQGNVDAQSAATDARREFSHVEAALRQEITKLSSGMQEHERIASELDRSHSHTSKNVSVSKAKSALLLRGQKRSDPSLPSCARPNRHWKPSSSMPRLRNQKPSKPEMLQGGC